MRKRILAQHVKAPEKSIPQTWAATSDQDCRAEFFDFSGRALVVDVNPVATFSIASSLESEHERIDGLGRSEQRSERLRISSNFGDLQGEVETLKPRISFFGDAPSEPWINKLASSQEPRIDPVQSKGAVIRDSVGRVHSLNLVPLDGMAAPLWQPKPRREALPRCQPRSQCLVQEA